MTFGLVLGGGGVVGIAWEIGVLEALLQEQALDPTRAATIIGTSAGSVVGTQLAAGQSVDDLVAAQLAPSRPVGGGATAPDMSAVTQIFGGLMTATEMTTELARQTGKLAAEAPTGSEDAWVGSFDALLGLTVWPEADLRVVAMSCTTGERRVWTKGDGVPVARAVASSCSVPGMFPPVTIDGDRYTDGGAWSPSNADLLAGEPVDQTLFIGPIGTFLAGKPQIEREAEVLEQAGVATATILPGEAFAELRMQLMNPAFRAQGLEVGRRDGKAAAAGVRNLLGG
ncbi:MAG TPA: patatin-like phospholipase family protein [Acidimicrobiales bacterium]|nr:patatin-like phospholipase family protein [Acidimicrobiales bacterium]